MDKVIKYAIAIGIIVIALSIAYYLVIFLPQKEKNRLGIQKQQEAAAVEKQKQEAELQAFTKELEIKKQNLEVNRAHLECAVSNLNEDGKKQCKVEVDKNMMRDDSNDWGL